MKFAVLALGLVACAGRAPTSSSDARDCFYVSAVSGFDDVGTNTVRLRTRGRSGYDVLLSGPQCDDVEWAPTIAVEGRNGTSSICVGEGVDLGEVSFRDAPLGRVVTCRIDRVVPSGS